MIKIGKLTDYAVVVLVQLMREGSDASFSAHHLAGRTGLPEPTVAKVLKKLSRARLVESMRGAAGGYKLAQAPTGMTVCAIIEAMEGPIAITSCVDNVCRTEMLCPAKGRWTPINTAIRAALSAVTLSDLAGAGARGNILRMKTAEEEAEVAYGGIK